MWTRLACGAAAGTTGQTVAYPFDVARRRLQVSLEACMFLVCAFAHCTGDLTKHTVQSCYCPLSLRLHSQTFKVRLCLPPFLAQRQQTGLPGFYSQKLPARLIPNASCALQVSGWSGAAALHAAENGGSAVAYTGMMDCFAKTVREEGMSALFKVRKALEHTDLCEMRL